MSMFRVVVHKPASGPIQLDLKEGTLALDATREALQYLGPLDNQADAEGGDVEGWKLRARRYVEEGRWWSEDDINEYSDRKSRPECCIKLINSYLRQW
jgi:hypothetical protein